VSGRTIVEVTGVVAYVSRRSVATVPCRRPSTASVRALRVRPGRPRASLYSGLPGARLPTASSSEVTVARLRRTVAFHASLSALAGRASAFWASSAASSR